MAVGAGDTQSRLLMVAHKQTRQANWDAEPTPRLCKWTVLPSLVLKKPILNGKRAIRISRTPTLCTYKKTSSNAILKKKRAESVTREFSCRLGRDCSSWPCSRRVCRSLKRVPSRVVGTRARMANVRYSRTATGVCSRKEGEMPRPIVGRRSHVQPWRV